MKNCTFENFLDDFNALKRDTIQRAEKVKGSKEYIEKQMKLFKEAEEHRKMLNAVIHQQEQISQEFVK